MSTCPDCETGRNLLAGACRSVFQRGLTGGSAGNMSLRVEGGILATPTGIPFGELTPGNLSLLDETGALVSGPKATKEAPFHLAWYKANPDHLAVVHLHSPWAVAVSCLADLDPGSPLPPLTPYQLMKLGHLAVAPYAKPGSAELCAGVARLAEGAGVGCQASLERMMGCGFGACSCCSVAMRDGTSRSCCMDGPVFDAGEVAW